ncbi:MAG: hypothetical protein IJN03_03215 [Bacilli bacterium]|nr:hypothetical protein [Bacilli bacterium]
MNLLEHWIKEIYSITEKEDESGTYIEVDMLINCWGCEERKKRRYSSIRDFNIEKGKGYYLA